MKKGKNLETTRITNHTIHAINRENKHLLAGIVNHLSKFLYDHQ